MAVLRTARLAGGTWPGSPVRSRESRAGDSGGSRALATSYKAYTCPAGHRAILRSVDVIAYGAVGAVPSATATADAAIWWNVGGGTYEGFEFMHEFWNGRYQTQWRGQVVMNSGEELWFYIGADLVGAYYHASGALVPIN